jgi:hypothetical protein
MVFLKDYSGSAKPLMLKPDLTGPGVGAGMIALGDVPGNAMTPKAASVVDRVILELAAAAQRRSTDERYLIYISMLLDVDHSPALRSTLKAWLGGRNRNLATLAAGLLFRTGDEEALERLGSELKASPEESWPSIAARHSQPLEVKRPKRSLGGFTGSGRGQESHCS